MGIIKLFLLLIVQSMECKNIDAVNDDPLSVENARGTRHTNERGPMDISDPKHGVKMGVPTDWCDNGKDNITVDWDLTNTHVYTCLPEDKRTFNLGKGRDKDPIHIYTKSKDITHHCMDKPIVYYSDIPTWGDHRPLWPVYGEYTYLPMQRLVHALEHGAIALLYHPCAKKKVVDKLKQIVTGCIWKHVITPYKKIKETKEAEESWAYALLAFENAILLPDFQSASADMSEVYGFIKAYGLRGPEGETLDDGQYSVGLLKDATIASKGINKTELCRQDDAHA